MNVNPERKYKPIIVGIAILIPVVVAILAYIPEARILGDFNYYRLPLINAVLNGTVFLLLIASFIAIRNKQVLLHKRLNTSAIALSFVFLVCYILYHAAAVETPYGGTGTMRTVYYVVLISHILLSAIIVPMVLITYIRGLTGKYERHKKIARYTWPI